MLPIKLTLQGIYSYQDAQTIDFTKLTSAGIFGIFGKVGSGKSTILEAIMFALFGDAERLKTADQRNYNMMNLKSNELFIDFEFQVAKVFYKIVVSGKRNRKTFDNVPKFDRRTYISQDNEWVPIDDFNPKVVLGLDYEHFKKSVIIPQNSFQEFILMKDVDRTRMLSDLFLLEKYDLYDKLGSKYLCPTFHIIKIAVENLYMILRLKKCNQH